MRYARFANLFALFFLAVPVSPQQTQPSTALPTSAPTPGTLPPPSRPIKGRSPQAVAALTQALAVGGGPQAINAITDYTAIGTITYHRDQDRDETGSVTVKGLGPDHFRLDADLPGGVRSYSVREGQVSFKDDHGVRHVLTAPPLVASSLIFPSLGLAAVLNHQEFALGLKTATQVNNRPMSVVHVQAPFVAKQPPAALSRDTGATDFFIDATTSQIIMTQDRIRSPGYPDGIPHQMQFSDYRLVNGVMVPFSITEVVNGQNGWVIQLTNISFSSGLQDADFVLTNN